MTIPAFLFGSLIAIFLGALFHLWKGGGPFYILLYLLASLVGFWFGHFTARYLQITFWKIGPLFLGLALVSAVLFLFVSAWLFRKNPTNDK